MSYLVFNRVQIGKNPDATKNFVLQTDGLGALQIRRGVAEAPGDLVGTFDANNNLVVPTLGISKKYTSPLITFAANARLNFAHGLTAEPTIIRLWFRVVTADMGYAVNEKIEVVNAISSSSEDGRGVTVSCDPTNVYLSFGAGAILFALHSKVAATTQAVNPANFKMFVEAWA